MGIRKFQVPSFKFQVKERKKRGNSAFSPTWNLELGTWNSSSGLSLVEVMLALMIVGIGISVLVGTASKCLAIIRQSRNYETARHLVGMVDVEKPLQLEDEIKPGTESDDFGSEYPSYRWTRTVELVGKEEDTFYRVKTAVMWSEHGNNAGEEVVTYLYAPEKPDQ